MIVSFLQPVLDAPGPVAPVCADVTLTTENADTEFDLKVRGRLLEGNDGGETGTLKGRAVVVAADGSEVLDQPLVDVPRQPLAERSPRFVLLAGDVRRRQILHDRAPVDQASAHGLSVTGTALAVEALRKSQVETLLLADEPDDEQLLVGGSPLELGVDQGDMQAIGVQESHPLPGDIPVAAILRDTDDPTASAQRTEESLP